MSTLCYQGEAADLPEKEFRKLNPKQVAEKVQLILVEKNRFVEMKTDTSFDESYNVSIEHKIYICNVSTLNNTF